MGMRCLRCGKETQPGQVFCEECLTDMERDPVRPGTAIQLPVQRQRPAAHKPPRRVRAISPEEQIGHLRKLVRWFAGAVAALSLLLLITAGMLVHTLLNQSKSNDAGRNYTAITSTPQP